MKQKKVKAKETFEEIKEHLDEWAYEQDVDEVCEYLKSKGAEYCDEGIDDGLDEEDEYLMYRVYSIGRYDVKLYYSNLERTVSYIEFRD